MVTKQKFHNRGVLFTFPCGHENVIEKSQKSTVYSLGSTKSSIILIFTGAYFLLWKKKQWEKIGE